MSIENSAVNATESYPNYIEEHPLLNGFTFNVDPEKLDVKLISDKGEVIKELDVLYFPTPSEVLEEYKSGKIDADKIAEKIKEFEGKQKRLQEKFDELGVEWMKGIYNSIHGGHRINTLVNKSLGLDTNEEYITEVKISLNKENITYIGNFGNKSLFVSKITKYGDSSYSGFSVSMGLLSIDDKSNMEIVNLSGDSLFGNEFNILDYNGNLILLSSKPLFSSDIYNSKNTAEVLVTSDGKLSESLFKELNIEKENLKQIIKRSKRNVDEVLGGRKSSEDEVDALLRGLLND